MFFICLGLASRYTSYVAVDPKANKPLEGSWMMMKSRDIPVQFAHGWHGGFGAPRMMMSCAASHSYSMAMPMSNMVPMALGGAGPHPTANSMQMRSKSLAPMARYMPMAESSDAVPITSMSLAGHGDEYMEACTDGFDDAGDVAVCDSIGSNFVMEPMAPAAPEPLTGNDKLIRLVDSQSFNGAFKTDSNIIAHLLETTVDDLKEGLYSNYFINLN